MQLSQMSPALVGPETLGVCSPAPGVLSKKAACRLREGAVLAEVQGAVVWRKSSYSDQVGQCCEVAMDVGEVLVRDSKQPDGSVLAFSLDAWRTAVASLCAWSHPGPE